MPVLLLRDAEGFLCGNMKLIPLSREMFAMVDDEDYDWLCQFSWCALKGGLTWYAVKKAVDGRRLVAMHQLLWFGCKGIDHRDNNGLNNTKENIRIATNQENGRNKQKTASATTSNFKGVYWAKDRNVWRGYIDTPRRKWLGNFATEQEAAVAYDSAAVQFFGEFANLNFPNAPRTSERTA
jgi:hypothetical protein